MLMIQEKNLSLLLHPLPYTTHTPLRTLQTFASLTPLPAPRQPHLVLCGRPRFYLGEEHGARAPEERLWHILSNLHRSQSRSFILPYKVAIKHPSCRNLLQHSPAVSHSGWGGRVGSGRATNRIIMGDGKGHDGHAAERSER